MTSWNANGDGGDVYASFQQSGRLSDDPIDDSRPAGAIAVSAKLHPGEVTTIPFALSVPPAPGTAWFLDKPGEYIYRFYDYARRHHDRAVWELINSIKPVHISSNHRTERSIP